MARPRRLDEDERDHLYLLAGHRPPAGRQAGDHVRPGLLYLLDRLTATPAQVVSDLGDVLAQNPMARALLGGVCTVSEYGRTWSGAGSPTRPRGRPTPPRSTATAAGCTSPTCAPPSPAAPATPLPGTDTTTRLDLLRVVGETVTAAPVSQTDQDACPWPPGPGGS